MQNSEIKTTCSYCGVGCGIIVKNDSKNGVTVTGDTNHPVNRGMLCSKGMNLHYVVNDTSDRILYPEMRWSKSHPMERVSWDAGLDRAAAVFSSLIKKHGPDSVGFYISGQCLTEEYYLVNKLVKGFLKTNNIDTNSRLCMSSAVAGYKKTFGEDSVPISYDDIELADTFLITGANPAWCHPILFRRLEQHKEKNPKVKIIVVDPRKTDSALAADLHLQIIPGTDIVLYHALAKRLIEKGYADTDFIKNHTENFNLYKNLVLSSSFEKASKLCGISIDAIKSAADIIGKAKGFISLWAMGLNQSAIGVDKNTALLNLSLLTGHIGKPGSGPFSLTGQPNAMGGREVGGLANLIGVTVTSTIIDADRNEYDLVVVVAGGTVVGGTVEVVVEVVATVVVERFRPCLGRVTTVVPSAITKVVESGSRSPIVVTPLMTAVQVPGAFNAIPASSLTSAAPGRVIGTLMR